MNRLSRVRLSYSQINKTVRLYMADCEQLDTMESRDATVEVLAATIEYLLKRPNMLAMLGCEQDGQPRLYQLQVSDITPEGFTHDRLNPGEDTRH